MRKGQWTEKGGTDQRQYMLSKLYPQLFPTYMAHWLHFWRELSRHGSGFHLSMNQGVRLPMHQNYRDGTLGYPLQTTIMKVLLGQ